MSKQVATNYGTAIRQAFAYLLTHHEEVFIIGQGLWSPWYVGNTMKNLEKDFGMSRVIDTPVSEAACTGAAVGASLSGMRPVIVHPRIDFMLYAMDAIVNQAAKWSHMTGGARHPALTIRGIINRGGEQGAQHSQALHSWFAHIPGLRVVMPSSVKDARDLMIAAVLSNDPVVYIDDRWLYDQEDELEEPKHIKLEDFKPLVVKEGDDITIIGSSYSTLISKKAALNLESFGISAEVIDLRVISPIDFNVLINSVKKTRRLLVVDGSWAPCGLSAEIIAGILEKDNLGLLAPPKRITLPFAPAPTSSILEAVFYPNEKNIEDAAKTMIF